MSPEQIEDPVQEIMLAALGTLIEQTIRGEIMSGWPNSMGWFSDEGLHEMMNFQHPFSDETATWLVAATWRAALSEELPPGVENPPRGLFWCWRISEDIEAPLAPDRSAAIIAVAYHVATDRMINLVYPMDPELRHWWQEESDDPDEYDDVSRVLRSGVELGGRE
jgi:hypothetical protein